MCIFDIEYTEPATQINFSKSVQTVEFVSVFFASYISYHDIPILSAVRDTIIQLMKAGKKWKGPRVPHKPGTLSARMEVEYVNYYFSPTLKTIPSLLLAISISF